MDVSILIGPARTLGTFPANSVRPEELINTPLNPSLTNHTDQLQLPACLLDYSLEISTLAFIIIGKHVS